MGISLQHIQRALDRVNVMSVADTFLNVMDSAKLLNESSKQTFSVFNNTSIDATIQIISRLAIARFIYPKISPVCSFINFSIGIIYLGTGIAQRFKIYGTPIEKSAEWNNVNQNIRKGFQHLLTAGYDYGIGVVFSYKYTNWASSIAFSAFPSIAFITHRFMFNKIDVSDESLFTSPPITDEQPNDSTSSSSDILDDLNSPRSLTPVPEEFTDSITPSDSDALPPLTRPLSSCVIFQIANVIASQLLPKISETPTDEKAAQLSNNRPPSPTIPVTNAKETYTTS